MATFDISKMIMKKEKSLVETMLKWCLEGKTNFFLESDIKGKDTLWNFSFKAFR